MQLKQLRQLIAPFFFLQTMGRLHNKCMINMIKKLTSDSLLTTYVFVHLDANKWQMQLQYLLTMQIQQPPYYQLV